MWKIEYLASIKKDVKKLDHQTKKRLHTFLEERVAKLDNPRDVGSALKSSKFGELWRYRVGDYRSICEIKDSTLNILTIKIGHRKEIYLD